MVEQLNERLSAVDPEIQQAVDRELVRQQSTLEMIASRTGVRLKPSSAASWPSLMGSPGRMSSMISLSRNCR